MNDEAFLDPADAQAVGFKVVELADRVRIVDLACPGSEAKSGFTIDGVRYEVTVRVDRSPNKSKATTP